jgi:hypothetical protein
MPADGILGQLTQTVSNPSQVLPQFRIPRALRRPTWHHQALRVSSDHVRKKLHGDRVVFPSVRSPTSHGIVGILF